MLDWLTGVGRERGMAGKWVGQNRLVVVTWRAGDGEEFATGFLPRHTAQIDELVAAVERHLPAEPPAAPAPDSSTRIQQHVPRTQPTPDGDQ